MSTTITVTARDYQTGADIADFSFLINENNVGDPQVDLAEPDRNPSLLPSLKPGASYSPVVASGDSGAPTITVPAGRYLVSTRASGYKLGGVWIEVADGESATVEAMLHPHPLPLSKIRVHVFHDNNPVNGEDDTPLESGLPGFSIVITDAVGEVTVDYFGNPIGTEYQRDSAGDLIFDTGGNPLVSRVGGRVLTDANGDAVIDNLPSGKYGVQAIPPDGSDWIQTTTIEGTHIIDAWIVEGNDGYSPREGFKMPLVWIGFVRPMAFDPPVPGVTGTISGTVKTIIEFVPPFRPLTLGAPVYRPWIALSDIGANDQQVYADRGQPDGTFFIQGVPPGVYQMAIWDEPLDYIIAFRTVQVSPGRHVDMGDVGVPRWYGYIKGKVFHDLDEDCAVDEGETGIANVAVGTRFKDGSVQYSTVTDMHGNYGLDEVFELERFAAAEVDFTSLGVTGAEGTPDYGIPTTVPTGCLGPGGEPARCAEIFQGALSAAALTWAAKTNKIDWGKRLYAEGENGGISGMIFYATMRNELNPRYAVAEDYEPGIPGVVVNLYSATVDPETGEVSQGDPVNTTTSDGWEHPTGCVDHNNDPVGCIEVPNISNQVRPGVYDGGYAFETYFDPYYGAPGAVEKPLDEGLYVVEIVPPEGYKAITESGSTNTSEGDDFARIVPTDPGEPEGIADEQIWKGTRPAPYLKTGTDTIDIHKKVVRVVHGFNAAANFFLYTDTPAPGRIVGFLLDDVNLETDPSFIYYGEKRGVPNAPVGIRDFTGRLIKTVYSDKNGILEVMLPSTYTRNVPTPSGVAPAMYQVVGNDPGDPENPSEGYNPNYQTLIRNFDVWPGKTTYADMAMFPITAFIGETGVGQFSRPPVCDLAADIPQLFAVDRVHVDLDAGAATERQVRILGTGFGAAPSAVTVSGVPVMVLSWSDEEILIEVPAEFTLAGPQQLLVAPQDGAVGWQAGITLHVIRAGEYEPNIVQVDQAGGADYETIQAAVDSEPAETIIVVNPGIYYESPIIHKAISVQGVGPGGTTATDAVIQGSVIDGRFYLSYLDQWLVTLETLDFDGPSGLEPDQGRQVPPGQVITVVARQGQYSPGHSPRVDGLYITGARGEEAGGIYLHAQCDHTTISNCVIQSNGGGFGGAVSLGRAYVGDNHNHSIGIHHNRILNNGGISLAGGMGIFNGAAGYEIFCNDICGNYSAEYGGGVSHFGYSPGGSIHHNRVLFNASFDEGGGIFVGGEQPAPPQTLTQGSGEVAIYANLIQGNLSNDDGGGIRLLQPLDYRIDIVNNLIVNNVSTDIGAGIALDDASQVVITNNTVAKNITTATAEDSDGLPHAAGLVSELHSAAFMSTLPVGSPPFSDPVLFNNIFWDNRSGWYEQGLNGGAGGIAGIGAAGDPAPVNIMDLEVFGSNFDLQPQYCSLSVPYITGGGNIVSDPGFAEEYDTELTAVAFNMEPDFRTVKIVTVTPELVGDYHLNEGSAVIDAGAGQVTRGSIVYEAPSVDFDGDSRPAGAAYDIGGDEHV